MRFTKIAYVACAILTCGGCSSQAVSPAPAEAIVTQPTGEPSGVQPSIAGKVQHVVFVVQENRSFDNLFQGYPGANTVSSGKTSTGQTVPLQSIPLEANVQLGHTSRDFLKAYDNGKMDGFDNEMYSHNNPYGKYPMYGYVPANESAPYFAIAHQYVLADNMFTSNIDISFESHQYTIAAQANKSVDFPNRDWGCIGQSQVPTLNPDRTIGTSESPCFDYQTVGDELDSKHLTWKYYAIRIGQAGGIWSAYQAVNHIYNGPDWRNISNPSAQFLTDVKNNQLATVTWITPDCPTSDHSGCQDNKGPQWVTSIINAVGKSAFWKTTTIFVVWDEWGGWYDHVAPPYKDYDGLGMRVPMLIVSPYAKQNFVSHKQYEMASVVRFIEDAFGLDQLATADARARSPGRDCFDFKQPPRTFVPFTSSLPPRYFVERRPDSRSPDDDAGDSKPFEVN